MSQMDEEWKRQHEQLCADLDEMDRLMLGVPGMIRRMTELQNHLHNQYGETGIAELKDAMDEALHGWMASNC